MRTLVLVPLAAAELLVWVTFIITWVVPAMRRGAKIWEVMIPMLLLQLGLLVILSAAEHLTR